MKRPIFSSMAPRDPALRVLLVEDEPTAAVLLVEELAEAAGDEIVVARAERVSEALEHLQAQGADCVLLDLSLPDAQGIEGIARVTESFPGVPVVVLTGTVQESVGIAALSAGADDFLIKGSCDGRGVARAARYAVERRRAAGLEKTKQELECHIAERRKAELALRESEARFRLLAEHATDAICVLDPAGTLTYASPATEAVFGYRPEELVGTTVLDDVHDLDVEDLRRALDRALTEGEVVTVQYRRRHRDRSWVWVETTARSVRDPETGEVVELQAAVRDIGERKRLEGRLRHLADHDALTGLVNRRRFEETLSARLEHARRYGPHGALPLLDLDNFKDVNDTLGHGTGDALIRATAEALRERLRGSDVIARLGGDEFAVLLPEATEEDAEKVASSLLCAVNERSVISRGGQRIHATTSIGIRLVSDAASLSGEDLLADADLAMYEAKESGRNRVVLYEPSGDFQARSRARLQSLERIRTALDDGLFELVSQPIIDLRTGEVSQHELLIRMREGDTLLPPAAFLSVAERFGLIQTIDRWVVREAVSLLAARRDDVRCVEINLSGDSLGDSTLPAYIEAQLAEFGVDAGQIIFEVTETAAISNMDRARSFVEQVRELGCRFALDDFGAGFGSFYYLKHLPFDFLRIDGEFIRDLPSSGTDRLIVEAVVATARGLGKLTVAEFVGDEQTVELLRELGVDYAQGYHLGRPEPTRELLVPAAT